MIKPTKYRELSKNERDLRIFEERSKEPTVSYKDFLNKLKRDGKIKK